MNKDATKTVDSQCLPGIHPSSEGKRKRNRSNVEAMTTKDLNHDMVLNNAENSIKSKFVDVLYLKNFEESLSSFINISRGVFGRNAEEDTTELLLR